MWHVGDPLQQSPNEQRLDAAIDSLFHRCLDSNGRGLSPGMHWFPDHTRLSKIEGNNGK